MTDQDTIKRLIEDAATEVQSAATAPLRRDADHLADLITSALDESRALPWNGVEEAFDVKGLHDRIHVCLVQIRATRHALDVVELSLDAALENVRRVGRMVEPDDDDEL